MRFRIAKRPGPATLPAVHCNQVISSGRPPRRCGSGLALAALAAAVACAADQPQWGEGWSRNQVSGERGLPASFDPAGGRNLRWVAALGGESHATPVVAGGRVLIGTNNQAPRDPRHKGDRGILLCLDEDDGSLLWQLVVPKLNRSVYWDWPESGICSPPTVEGDRIYLVSNRGEVLCLDAAGMANGNDGPFLDEARHAAPADSEPVPVAPTDADILWAFDLIGACGVRQHDQAHASILVHGNHLYLNTSNGLDDGHRLVPCPEAPSLVVLDKRDGRLLATDGQPIGPRIFHCTWSSPALARLDGRDVIVFCGGDGVVYAFEPLAAAPPAGAAPAALRLAWQCRFDPAAPTRDVHRYLRNRKEGPSHVMGMPVFHDGRLYIAGGGDLWWGKRGAWLKCFRLTGTGDATGSAEAWSCPLEDHTMSTPAVAGGLVFVSDCRANLHCVDAATGDRLWSHKTTGPCWASPLVADGKVFVGTQSGWFHVLDAGRTRHELAAFDLGRPISATAVAANRTLYVATMDRLCAARMR